MANGRAIACSALLFVTSCAPAPFQIYGSKVRSESEDGLPASLFLKHLRCEAYRAVLKAWTDGPKSPATNPWDTFQNLYYYTYVAAGRLTLDVIQSEGLNPSGAFINPYTPMTNFTLTVGGQLNGVQHRNFELNLAIDFRFMFKISKGKVWPVTETPDPQPKDPQSQDPIVTELKQCKNATNDGTGIQGELGLYRILEYGLGAFQKQDEIVFPGSASASGNTATTVFGSTLDFTITEGLNIGPNWTLTHFKGPAGGGTTGGGTGAAGGTTSGGTTSGSLGGNSGLANFNRSAKDTLVISFAPACKQNDAPPDKPNLPNWEKSLAKCDQNNNKAKPQLDIAVVLANLDNTLRNLPKALQVATRRGSNAAVPSLEELKNILDDGRLSSDKTVNYFTEALKAAQENNTQLLLQNAIPTLQP